MTDKMTCEEFNSRLSDFVSGRMSASAASVMKGHLDGCERCREIYTVKRALVPDPSGGDMDVPADVEKELVNAVITDIAAAGEPGIRRRSWASRYLMPALAAAVVIFVFLTGFMLGEIRSLNREAAELRGEVSAMGSLLAGRAGRDGSVFERLAGELAPSAGMTIGEAARILEALPEKTPVLTEEDAERLIAGNHRLRRLVGRIEERPWEGGLTSGELLLVIIALDIDPDTRIPDEWSISKNEI